MLLMIKQIAKQAAMAMIKDQLSASLDGMGCKGVAWSNVRAALWSRPCKTPATRMNVSFLG